MIERQESIQPLPFRLGDVLLLGPLAFYDAALPPDLQEQYERALHSVVRQSEIREKGFPLPEGYLETDLKHTIAGCEMVTEFMQAYPVLKQFINFDDVQIMFGLHDSGEIVPAIGDVRPVNRTPQDNRKKRLEPFAAKKFVIAKIPDPVMRQQALAYYDRYNRNDPDDIEVQLARFIDKTQGTTRVADKAFNIHTAASDEVRNEIKRHLFETLPRMMRHATRLLVLLETREAREAMENIILGELGYLAEYGPKEVAESVLDELAA